MSAPDVVLPPEQSFPEMQQSPHAAVHWIWEGYVAAGAVTLFTSRWKTVRNASQRRRTARSEND